MFMMSYIDFFNQISAPIGWENQCMTFLHYFNQSASITNENLKVIQHTFFGRNSPKEGIYPGVHSEDTLGNRTLCDAILAQSQLCRPPALRHLKLGWQLSDNVHLLRNWPANKALSAFQEGCRSLAVLHTPVLCPGNHFKIREVILEILEGRQALFMEIGRVKVNLW